MVAKNASLQRTTAAVRGAGVPAWPSAHFLLREYAAQKTSHSRGTLCAISPQRALALGAAHRAQQEEPKTECRRKKYEIRRMGQKQSYSFQVESP